MQTEKNYLTVFSQRLAGQLMQDGFVLMGMGKNDSNPDKNVFFFNDGDKIRAIVKEYMNKRTD